MLSRDALHLFCVENTSQKLFETIVLCSGMAESDILNSAHLGYSRCWYRDSRTVRYSGRYPRSIAS